MTDKRAPEPTEADIARAAKSKAREVYEASDGKLTVAFYRRLCARGPAGIIAMNLMRAQKTSSRAKVYRGRQYRNASYETKNYSLDQLCVALEKDSCGIKWGFGSDDNTPGFVWVVYADLPGIGQVSFHTDHRGDSLRWPNYDGIWDGAKGMSESRILEFCDAVLKLEVTV
jgi:hypothetical protein